MKKQLLFASVLIPPFSLCSKEDKQLFAVLLKPCLDISMWKGSDPADHRKNAAYYELWSKRLTAAGSTIEDSMNKYQVN